MGPSLEEDTNTYYRMRPVHLEMTNDSDVLHITAGHSSAQHSTAYNVIRTLRTGERSQPVVVHMRWHNMHGKKRTGQDRTGQDRTGQDRTGQDRT